MATVGTIMTITDLSGNTYNIHGMLYGQCDTAATTKAKTVTIPGITNLATGLSIRVRFVYAQSYNGVPTLNVNNLGAKNIRRSSASDAAIYEWVANEILDLVYDGTYWVIVNGGKANASDVYSKTEAVAKADIVNNLTSTATNAPLSANMGKTLNDNMTPSVSTGFTYEADVSGYNYQCFAMKQGKVVVLSCAFKITSNKSTYTKLATLPSGFWPTEEIEFISMSYYGQGVYAMYITNQGELYCRNGINATNMLIFNVTYIQV